MQLFRRLPGYRRTPYGLELRLLRKVPWMLAGCTAVPLLLVLAAGWWPAEGSAAELAKWQSMVQILAVALAVTGWTAVLTLALGCCVVWVMKGPAYVADAYELIDFDEPAPDRRRPSGN